MIKVKVIEEFTLGNNPEYKFEDLKNIVRAEKEEKGRLFKNDTFECDNKMADYLLGTNGFKRPFVKKILEKKVVKSDIAKKEIKSKKSIEKK